MKEEEDRGYMYIHSYPEERREKRHEDTIEERFK